MRTQLDLSYEFFLLVKQLQKTPDDPSLKRAVVKLVPQMMVLAQSNPLALYRLAHMYPPTSSQFKNMMKEAAQRGCANAMLALSDLIINASSSSPKDLETAAHYLKKISSSKDSYMKQQSKALLSHPKIAKCVTYADSNIHFFATQSESAVFSSRKCVGMRQAKSSLR